MGPLGFPELLLIMVLALLLFGPRKLPEIGKTLGRTIGEFKRASDDLKRTLNAEIAIEEARESTQRNPPRAATAQPAIAPSPSDGAETRAAATESASAEAVESAPARPSETFEPEPAIEPPVLITEADLERAEAAEKAPRDTVARQN